MEYNYRGPDVSKHFNEWLIHPSLGCSKHILFIWMWISKFQSRSDEFTVAPSPFFIVFFFYCTPPEFHVFFTETAPLTPHPHPTITSLPVFRVEGMGYKQTNGEKRLIIGSWMYLGLYCFGKKKVWRKGVLLCTLRVPSAKGGWGWAWAQLVIHYGHPLLLWNILGKIRVPPNRPISNKQGCVSKNYNWAYWRM